MLNNFQRIIRYNKRFATNSFSEIVAMKGTKQMLEKRLPLTKIVATIGPASENLPMLSNVVNAGMRIMRINFSHATYEEADLRVKNLNKCFGINHTLSATTNIVPGESNMRAVLLDTQGPEIRTGSFGNGIKEIELTEGKIITLSIDEKYRTQQDANYIWISYKKLYDTVSIGSSILLDDGIVELKVEEKVASNGEVVCRVMNQGMIGNKKGVNMPGLTVDLPAMCDKDKVDIRWGIQNNVDYIAASFVRKASDITEIRDYCGQLMEEMFPTTNKKLSNPLPAIIAKIESVEALVNFDAILAESDGIMVARGDLAVEIPMESLANVQKEIVKRCNIAGKPVIVATQMLESMQKNPRPTRAECTDVANAVIDGADCVMLSGESAKGKYPTETVALMNRIVHQAELGMIESQPLIPKPIPAITDSVEAMAYSIVQSATSQRENQALTCIVVMMSSALNNSSTLAKHISKYRPHVPIICIVPDHKSGRLLQVYKGIHPVLMLPETDRSETTQVLLHLRKLGLVKLHDQVLVARTRTAEQVISISLCSV